LAHSHQWPLVVACLLYFFSGILHFWTAMQKGLHSLNYSQHESNQLSTGLTQPVLGKSRERGEPVCSLSVDDELHTVVSTFVTPS